MQDPKLYIKGNALQRRDAVELLSEYLHLIQWRGTEDETVLDLGCGTGDVTWDILKPRLLRTVRISGADIAEEMLTYAAKTYPDVNFLRLDIGQKNIPKHLYTAFDHIFSFYCLQWIDDLRQAMQNIYDMLKPGGDIFTYYVAHHVFKEAFFNSSNLMKWSDYLDKSNSYPFCQNDDYLEKDLKKILVDVGFNVSVCKVIARQFVYSNIKMLKAGIRAISPYLSRIPVKLREEFVDDTVHELFKFKVVKQEHCKNSKQIVIPYTLVIIVASKSN